MTPAKRKRTESELVRRAQLLSAARKVFRAKGYEGASISDIVRGAGLAQGTFYLYFPSKRDVAIALRDGLMETMAQAVVRALEPDASFDDRLETLTAETFRVARQNTDLLRLAFVGADETHPELHSESAEHALFLTTFVNLFREAVDSGVMEEMDPEIAARLVTGLLQHAVFEAFIFGNPKDVKRLEKGVAAFLRNALKKR